MNAHTHTNIELIGCGLGNPRHYRSLGSYQYKHTVFGRVIKGMDVCAAIENVKTNDLDKPYDDILIASVDIL